MTRFIILILLYCVNCEAAARGDRKNDTGERSTNRREREVKLYQHDEQQITFVDYNGNKREWSPFRSFPQNIRHNHLHLSSERKMMNDKKEMGMTMNKNMGMSMMKNMAISKPMNMQMGMMMTMDTPAPVFNAPVESSPVNAPTVASPVVSSPIAALRAGDELVVIGSRSKDVVTQNGGTLNSHFENSPMFRSFQNRIVGGTPAGTNEFKFIASLNVGCGGSLIAPGIILTAAHCAGNIRTARIGSNKANSGGVVKSVTTECMHPNYQSSTTTNDYLLLKLDSPVDTNQFPPIQLNNNKAFPQTNQILTVIGYGATSEGGSGSNTLLKVSVPANSHQQCNQQYGGSIVENVMFCAGNKSGGKDSCQGDSGGPIFEIRGGKPVQVGVVSFGEGCARPNRSGVYSRVSGAYDWIQTTIVKLNKGDTSGCRGGKPSPPTRPSGKVPTPKPVKTPTKRPSRTKRPTESPTEEPVAPVAPPTAPSSPNVPTSPVSLSSPNVPSSPTSGGIPSGSLPTGDDDESGNDDDDGSGNDDDDESGSDDDDSFWDFGSRRAI